MVTPSVAAPGDTNPSDATVRINFTFPETILIVLLIFIPLDKTPECDGQTDGQKWSGYYSVLHCEQNRRAVSACHVGIHYSRWGGDGDKKLSPRSSLIATLQLAFTTLVMVC